MQNDNSKCKGLKKILLKVIFFIAVFVFAVGVWYSPVIFKGYSAHMVSQNALLGRNVAETNLYTMENEMNITLPPALLKEQGQLSTFGNKLTSIFYGKLFQIIGIPIADNIVLVSIFIYALTLLIFTITVYYLFDLKVAAIFAILYIFLPFNWYAPYYLGTNEFSLFFLSLFFLFFFLGEKQKKYQCNYFLLAGVFLAISGIAKEAMFLIAPLILLYMWLKNRRALLYIFIPFFVLVSIFWLPKFKDNSYIQFFSLNATENVQDSDFSFYGHAYPDPYTYYYDKEAFLQEYIDIDKLSFIQKLERLKIIQNMGIDSISIFARFTSGTMISARHIFRFISFEDIGGPFIFLLLLLGLYVLKKEDENMHWLLTYWVITAILFMSFIVMASRNHFADFNLAIALLVALGTIEASKIFARYLNATNKKGAIILTLFVALIIYNLISANHVAWSRIYDGSSNLKKQAYSEKINEMNVADSDVIAVSFGAHDICYISYLNSKSYVTFREETIEKLLAKNELQAAFETFEVKYILGYSDSITEKIVEKINVVNIATDSIKPITPEISRNKSWFMNVVK